MSDYDYQEGKTGFLHEALDRSHMVSMHLQTALETHPVVLEEKEVRVAYENAVDAIESLYQLLGRRFAQSSTT